MPSPIQSVLKSRFARDVITMQVGKFVPMLCGLLSSILYARFLGLGGYGTYAVVLAFTGVIGLFTNLGQENTTITFLAEAYGRREKDAMIRVGSYYAVMSLGTIILLGAALPFLPWITHMLYGNAQIGQLAQLVFLASMIDPFYIFVTIALQTVREIRLLTLLENVYITVQVGISIVLLLMGYGVAGVLWGSLLTSILSMPTGLIAYASVRQRYDLPKIRDLFAFRQFRSIRRYMRDGIWIAIDKSIGNLYPNLFLFALSLRSTPAVVGLVRLGFKFGSLPASYVLSNVSRLAASVIPTLTGTSRNILRTLRTLFTYTFLLHGTATLIAGIAVPLLFPYVYGDSFAVALYPFLVILTLHLLLALHAMITPVLRLYGKVYLATILNIAGMTLAMSWFFLSSDRLSPTIALYGSLAIYHVMSGMIVFPAYRLLRKARPISA